MKITTGTTFLCSDTQTNFPQGSKDEALARGGFGSCRVVCTVVCFLGVKEHPPNEKFNRIIMYGWLFDYYIYDGERLKPKVQQARYCSNVGRGQ